MKRALAERKLSEPFKRHLHRIVQENNRKAHNRKGQIAERKTCSEQTRKDRAWFYEYAFAELAELGYHLSRPDNLREKHVEALARHWQSKGLAIRTLHTRISMLRVLAGWIGKPGMVGDIEKYFPELDLTRTSAAERNRAWDANGVDAAGIIEQAMAIDKRFGVMLLLQKAFGLRVKESIELRPLRAVSGSGEHLMVIDGTKGGLPRAVSITTSEQRSAIDMAIALAMKSKSKRLRWDGMTYRKAYATFYTMAGKMGLTRKEKGVTAHGLRHQFAQERVKTLTGGHPTPIEMKETMPGVKPTLTQQENLAANQAVSLELGHRRPDVGSFYYGSFGHQLREVRDTQWQLNKWGIC